MKILQILSSLNTENSASTELTNAIIKKLKKSDSQIKIVTRDLAKTQMPHLTDSYFKSLSKQEEIQDAEISGTIQLADELIDELLGADIIVIGVPMYNFTIPSILKSWIDFIARAGKTFRYTAEGSIGLVQNKKVYLAISSGNVFTVDHMKQFDFTESYLRTVLGFLGITDVECFRVEGLGIPGIQETAMEIAVKNVEKFCF